MSSKYNFHPSLAPTERPDLLRQITEEHRHTVICSLLHAAVSPYCKTSMVEMVWRDYLKTEQMGRICRLDYLIENHLPKTISCSMHLAVFLCAEAEMRALYELTEKDEYSLMFPLSHDAAKQTGMTRLKLLALADAQIPSQRFALELIRPAAAPARDIISDPSPADRFPN